VQIRLIGWLAILLLTVSVSFSAPRLGINLAGPSDWNTELPFVDVFHLSRAWISQREGVKWGTGPKLALDAHGWVTALEPGCWVDTLLCTIDGGHYPAGEYTLLYDGEGEFNALQAATVTRREPGRITLQVNPAKGAICLQLRKTNPQNYVRNIRVIMPGFLDSYRTNPFHPAFLQRWKGVACLRFMNWMATNNSPLAHWTERPLLDDATWTTHGIPLEIMLDLANRLHADPWFCIPHQADDDFVRRFAILVKEKFAPERTVYLEYSNELWNSIFQQCRYVRERGVAEGLGTSEKSWEAGWRYGARRSAQLFAIWEEVFGGHTRLVRVLGTQAGNDYIANIITEQDAAYQHADALAIAPYLGLTPSPRHPTLKPEQVAEWPVDKVLDYLEQTVLPATTVGIRKLHAVAAKHGLCLLAYEGGQHLVGINGGENCLLLTALFKAANASPRMADLYQRYFAAWTNQDGDLFCYFSSVSAWSKWGSWGAMQYYDETPEQSPKYRALQRWARECGQAVGEF